MVRKTEAGVETFAGQVGDLAAVAFAGQTVGNLPGQRVGEGLRVMVTDDDQSVHGGSPFKDAG
ncbi:hypothetical protein D3C75_1118220 [compost metagenome]